jgi:D-beta-D-heptose 7-phosphate kinase/D-beta-D-heptose 1-phosphate adenosyltransferase
MGCFVDRDEFVRRLATARSAGRRVVFTNGCFDLLHLGHVRLLQAARELGDLLAVGVNTDRSVRELKGPDRPFTPQEARAEILSALACVDLVTLFDEPTPARLVEEVVPDVLVKGGDYRSDQVVGRETVEAAGGEVRVLPLVAGYSTSELIRRARCAA